MTISDHITIPVACESCGNENQETLSRLQSDPKVICVCGTVINVVLEDSDEATEALENLDDSLRKLGFKL